MTRMSSPLFDYEIPVSEAEVEAWLDQLPNLSALKSRRKAYRRCHPCFSYRKLWLMRLKINFETHNEDNLRQNQTYLSPREKTITIKTLNNVKY
jgi:hypothetical protein